jgi:hypothetical protein
MYESNRLDEQRNTGTDTNSVGATPTAVNTTSCVGATTADTTSCVSTHITVFRRTDGQPAGKTLTLNNDGNVSKSVVKARGYYQARTLPLKADSATAALEHYKRLLHSLTGVHSVVLSHAPCVDGAGDYQTLEEWDLEKRGLNREGINFVDGKPTIGWLKVNYTPSQLGVLDFDVPPHMPAELAALSLQERIERTVQALPELAGAAMLAVPSSTGRVLNPDGSVAYAAGGGAHVYFVFERELSPDELDDLRHQLMIRLTVAGCGWSVESTNKNPSRYCGIQYRQNHVCRTARYPWRTRTRTARSQPDTG